MLVHHPKGCICGERNRTRQHFKEHDTQRINIGARIDHATFPLLRRHIGWCPDDCPALCQTTSGGIKQFSDPKVGQKGILVFVKQHVLRLEIAMDNSPAVRVVESTGDLFNHARGHAHGQRTLLNQVRKATTRHLLHDEVDNIFVLPVIKDLEDMRVAQGSYCFCFALETINKALRLDQS